MNKGLVVDPYMIRSEIRQPGRQISQNIWTRIEETVARTGIQAHHGNQSVEAKASTKDMGLVHQVNQLRQTGCHLQAWGARDGMALRIIEAMGGVPLSILVEIKPGIGFPILESGGSIKKRGGAKIDAGFVKSARRMRRGQEVNQYETSPGTVQRKSIHHFGNSKFNLLIENVAELFWELGPKRKRKTHHFEVRRKKCLHAGVSWELMWFGRAERNRFATGMGFNPRVTGRSAG